MFGKKAKDNTEKSRNNQQDVEWIVLKQTGNILELNVIEGLLEDNKIPYLLKDYGAGDYMRIIGGSSMDGTDVLVEKSYYDHAKELVDEIEFEAENLEE